MSEPVDGRDPLEAGLARRFGHLREVEGRQAPDVPVLRPSDVAVGRNIGARVSAAAVAVAALLFVAVPRGPSPDELYLEVMGESELLTDELLIVSPLALPEGIAPPSLFDPGPFEPVSWEEGGDHDV